MKSINKRIIYELEKKKRYHQQVYIRLIQLSYVLYFLLYFGSFNNQNLKLYIENISTVVRVYVSIILLIRFNPLVKTRLTKFDRRLVFSASIMVLIASLTVR